MSCSVFFDKFLLFCLLIIIILFIERKTSSVSIWLSQNQDFVFFFVVFHCLLLLFKLSSWVPVLKWLSFLWVWLGLSLLFYVSVSDHREKIAVKNLPLPFLWLQTFHLPLSSYSWLPRKNRPVDAMQLTCSNCAVASWYWCYSRIMRKLERRVGCPIKRASHLLFVVLFLGFVSSPFVTFIVSVLLSNYH